MAIVHHNEKEKEDIFPTTLATIESLTIPLVQEVVVLADFQCKRCQDRVADILSRLNGEAESVEFSFTEKKVTLTLISSRNPRESKMTEQNNNNNNNNDIYKNSGNKFSLVKRMFSSSSSSST